MGRHDLSDAAWSRISEFLPRGRRRGRPRADDRVLLNGMIWLCRTGAAWRDLPAEYGPWSTVYGRFRAWRLCGLWARLLSLLLSILDDEGDIDRELWLLDGTCVRAHKSAAGGGRWGGEGEPADHALGRSQGGFGSKLAVMGDSRRHPLGLGLMPINRHDSVLCEEMLDSVRIPQRRGRPRTRPKVLAADKAYSSRRIRRACRRRRIQHAIHETEKQKEQRRKRGHRPIHCSGWRYRHRVNIEHLIGHIKEFRRVATRYDKTANSFSAFVHIAAICILLRRL